MGRQTTEFHFDGAVCPVRVRHDIEQPMGSTLRNLEPTRIRKERPKIAEPRRAAQSRRRQRLSNHRERAELLRLNLEVGNGRSSDAPSNLTDPVAPRPPRIARHLGSQKGTACLRKAIEQRQRARRRSGIFGGDEELLRLLESHDEGGLAVPDCEPRRVGAKAAHPTPGLCPRRRPHVSPFTAESRHTQMVPSARMKWSVGHLNSTLQLSARRPCSAHGLLGSGCVLSPPITHGHSGIVEGQGWPQQWWRARGTQRSLCAALAMGGASVS